MYHPRMAAPLPVYWIFTLFVANFSPSFQLLKSGTYLVMFQGKGLERYQILKNEECVLKSESGSSIALNLESGDKIFMQGHGSGTTDSDYTHLSVIRIF